MNDKMKTQESAASVLYCLPRELRNRVYTFCVQGSYDDEVIIRRASYSTNAIALFTRECVGPQSYRWIEDPTMAFISTCKLGEEMAREMLETYYWIRTFKFSHRDQSLITPFLSIDHFGLGLSPACYVRRLQIQLLPGPLISPHSNNSLQSKEVETSKAIESLGVMLSTRTAIVINVEVCEELNGSSLVNSTGFSTKLTQAVHSLREKGLRVVIEYSRSWDG